MNPGDWIVGDGDGIVVIAAQELQTMLERAEEDARIEARMMARIKAGASVLDAVNEERRQCRSERLTRPVGMTRRRRGAVIRQRPSCATPVPVLADGEVP